MGITKKVRLRDLRDIYLLAGRCCEVGKDPLAWHRIMAQGLSEIFDSRLGISGMVALSDLRDIRYTATSNLGIFDWGWNSAEQRQSFIDYSNGALQKTDPSLVALNKIPGKLICRRRRDVLTDQQWYESPHYQNYFRHWGIDDIMFSMSRAATNYGTRIHWINIGRDLGETPFSLRDKRMFYLFVLEVHRLLDNCLAPFGDKDILRLSPRLLQVLSLLTEGLSEKQIALRLHLSRHTVHDYTKALHKHFDVSSRSELLAKWQKHTSYNPHN